MSTICAHEDRQKQTLFSVEVDLDGGVTARVEDLKKRDGVTMSPCFRSAFTDIHDEQRTWRAWIFVMDIVKGIRRWW